MKNSVLFKWGQ